MERFAIKKMLAWKQSSRRKPLILKGVRQVGKTWILKEFGKRYYKNLSRDIVATTEQSQCSRHAGLGTHFGLA